jgi:hypothetical protein
MSFKLAKTQLNHWGTFFKSTKNKLIFIGLGLAVAIGLCLTSFFLLWNESREGGTLLNDPILSLFGAVDVSIYTFFFTYLGIGMGLLYMFRKPRGFIVTMVSILCIIGLRTITMTLIPLEAPLGIIPLRDVFLESTFYSGLVLEKDLFFSGHTANVFLLGFLAYNNKIKIALFVIASIVGMLVLIQHVHYTVDVVAAPFFAYIASIIGTYISKKYCIN